MRWHMLLVTALLLIGTRSLASGFPSEVVAPLSGADISSRFGSRIHPVFGDRRQHQGIDLPAPYGAPARAVAAGIVVSTRYERGYGNLVVVMHKDGWSSLYAHLSSWSVSVGDAIHAGTIIGRVGTTGNVTGPHLHFEVRFNDRPVSPTKLLPFLTATAAG